jgi:uncharacterized protein (TIGR00303 family)
MKSSIIVLSEKEKARPFLRRIKGKNPAFVCVLGNTETAKIPGLSAAGANPDITDYTPPADAEFLFYEKCKCIPGVPITPDGIPTPAIITRAALKLADIPVFIAVGGLRIKPQVPYIDLGGAPGKDIKSGDAIENAEEIFRRGEVFGLNLASTADYLVVGESVAGGTTTALAVMLAMGINAKGKVSSSMSGNPHGLKESVVEEGMKNAGVSQGDLKNEPMDAVSKFGDPMMPAFAGIVCGASEEVPVLLAGGTQMGAVLSVVKGMKKDALKNVAVGTTKWIASDKTSDLAGIVKQIGRVPILAANIDFSASKHEGLRAYERGMVKEGVGCGGAAIAAILKKKELRVENVVKETEAIYGRLRAGIN